MIVDFNRKSGIGLTLGHVLPPWEMLSGKFSDLRPYGQLDEDKRRAVWKLADELEKTLYCQRDNGLAASRTANPCQTGETAFFCHF